MHFPQFRLQAHEALADELASLHQKMDIVMETLKIAVPGGEKMVR